jgi:uncharacterized damage-inducible protein DinB
MSRTAHLRLMAEYNQWMNTKVYEAAQRLSHEELVADRQAFFGSLFGTLNHLCVSDTIWLKRFAAHPAQHPALNLVRPLLAPSALDQLLHTDLPALSQYRQSLDHTILAWAQALTEVDLNHVLHYTNTKGVVAHKAFFSLAVHFFNHQTHHRGQATTLLSQAGVDVGMTDLLALIPNEE